MDHAPIYEDGRHYDGLYGTTGPDVDIFAALAGRACGDVLELACGTGKFLLPIAAAGVRVVGLDCSAAMLAWAAEKARAAGVAVELHHADMRDFVLPGRFALVFIAGNSFCHLMNHDDARRMLACVRRHLLPGATFVVDVFVPDVRLLARDAAEVFAMGAYEDPDDGMRIEVSGSQRYDASTQTLVIESWRRRPDGDRPQRGELRLRMWFPCELEAALHTAGFEVVERFGGHDRSAFGANSGKQILICRAAG